MVDWVTCSFPLELLALIWHGPSTILKRDAGLLRGGVRHFLSKANRQFQKTGKVEQYLWAISQTWKSSDRCGTRGRWTIAAVQGSAVQVQVRVKSLPRHQEKQQSVDAFRKTFPCGRNRGWKKFLASIAGGHSHSLPANWHHLTCRHVSCLHDMYEFENLFLDGFKASVLGGASSKGTLV